MPIIREPIELPKFKKEVIKPIAVPVALFFVINITEGHIVVNKNVIEIPKRKEPIIGIIKERFSENSLKIKNELIAKIKAKIYI